jgi:hypothetical protein
MIPGLFSAMCTAIALKLCTWLYIYDLQTKFEDGCYRPIFGRLTPLEFGHFKGFDSFQHFLSAYRYSFDILYICALLCHTEIQLDPQCEINKNIVAFTYMYQLYRFSMYIMVCINLPITPVYVLQNNESGFPLIFTITGGIVILPLN